MNGHTRGPWKVQPNSRNPLYGYVVSPNASGQIATVHANWKANASLIAAAPDLLNVLHDIVKAWDAVQDDEQVPESLNDPDMWDTARAVIFKAGGQT